MRRTTPALPTAPINAVFPILFHTASTLSAPTGHLPLEGKADDTGIPSSKMRRSRHLHSSFKQRIQT